MTMSANVPAAIVLRSGLPRRVAERPVHLRDRFL
jgi:hypothetical protein